MSEIITDTITGKSTATTITIGSTPVVSSSANSMTIRGEGSAQTSIQQGLAKAWAAFNQSGTHSFRDSSNFSSITDVDVGVSRFVFTNSMANADYATTGMSGEQTGGGNRVMGLKGSTATPASTGFDIGNFELTNGTASDDTRLSVAVLGDLS